MNTKDNMKIIKFKAKDNFEMGERLGKFFGAKLRKLIKGRKFKKGVALKYLPPTKKYFPHLVEELRGYAQAAKVDFEDLWALGLEEDMTGSLPPNPAPEQNSAPDREKCTSIISNGFVGHTEDWFTKNADHLFLIQKEINNLKILEFFYFYTLGGNAFSVNSYGVIQLTNSMVAKDKQIGVPNHIIARWLSETKDPEKDFHELNKIKRAGGENYIFIKKDNLYCLETTAKKAVFYKPERPFIHTNHYLTDLANQEEYRSESSIARFNAATKLAPTINSIDGLRSILSQPPIYRNNEKDLTIATAIVDLNKKIFHYRLNQSHGEINISSFLQN